MIHGNIKGNKISPQRFKVIVNELPSSLIHSSSRYHIMPEIDPYEYLNIRIDPDGTVTRLLNLPPANANPDLNSGEAVFSKDAILSEEKNTAVRIYLPSNIITKHAAAAAAGVNEKMRLPIVFHFHGCSWVQFRSNCTILHASRSLFAFTIPAIVILVDYRLSPENRLPAPYEDATDALLWLQKQALDPQGEKWLKDYGDFSRCYLHGSGCGGNIAFNAALRSLDMDLSPLKIDGIILNQPLFGGRRRTKSEMKFIADQVASLPAMDLMWELALPEGADRDHPFCNPMADGPHKSKLRSLQRCLLFGFGRDPLVDRQQEFVQMLILHGVKVEACFDDSGFHRVDIVDPQRAAMLDEIAKGFIDS